MTLTRNGALRESVAPRALAGDSPLPLRPTLPFRSTGPFLAELASASAELAAAIDMLARVPPETHDADVARGCVDRLRAYRDAVSALYRAALEAVPVGARLVVEWRVGR